MTTLHDVLTRVDTEQIRVLWLAGSSHQTQELARWIREHHDLVDGARVWVARGREMYRHPDGGQLRIVSTTAQLRGMTADLAVFPAGYIDARPLAVRAALRLPIGEVAEW